jgi:hypothetical protein
LPAPRKREGEGEGEEGREGGRKGIEFYWLTAVEAGKPKSRCWHLVRAFLLQHDMVEASPAETEQAC